MLIYHRKIPSDFSYSPFTAHDRTPFFYILINKKTGKRYAGSKTNKGCHPTQFWNTTYFPNKAINKIIEKEGKESFIFEIRSIFDNIEKCISYENKFLKKIHAGDNPNWYNLNDDNKPISISNVYKINKYEKLHWMNNGKKEIRSAILPIGFSLGRIKGKAHPKMKGKKLSQIQKNNISKSLIGHETTQETREKISEKIKNQPKNYTCPYCGKSFNKGHYNQWHGEKCKCKILLS